jgi:hypothetical protein
MTPVVTFILVVVLLLAAGYYMSRYLYKRAIRRVVALFRREGATNPKNAKTLAELGLARTGLADTLLRPRDYKPYALRTLVQANVIREAEGGRAYLSEDELERSPIKKLAKIKEPRPTVPVAPARPAKPVKPEKAVKPKETAKPGEPAPPAEGPRP